ncbi:bis(5'-nucleosyl)-tetraphosphatase (symmetrical) YqeK [Brevibacillus daliensis]|uniref:bis(5'-nucleosyl)-tetraphosphatase (symmetrical) YqeK n=1 Tax=Brevibacillus daliensis TaxID=2892995 RepID=UPI001E52B845|nr:bis(5'-nucleosyl)-tetraphosphatase (symmetrical) YqeK [Brevibacillus daliensis]
MELLENREALLVKIHEQMHEKRYLHTLGVAETAKQLAIQYGADPKKAELAGLLHDYCKCWESSRMKELLLQHDHPEDLLDADKSLWHSFAGAIAVQEEVGVTDEEILDAIRYHTSGRPQMTLLEKVVCLADYIEPNRTFPGVDELRKGAETELESTLQQAFGGTIKSLVKRNQRVYPLTILAYNDLIQK